MDIKEKIEKIEELRYEISRRTSNLYKIKTAKEYDREKEEIKELKKNFEMILSEVEKEVTYIFFNKKIIDKIREEFSKLKEEERKREISENSGLVKEVIDLLKKNWENREKISSFIIDLKNLPEEERKNFKEFFQGEKDYLKTKYDLRSLKEICEAYGIIYKRGIFGDVELRRKGKEEGKEEKKENILYKILPFLDGERAEREKKIKEIDREMENLDKKIKEILEKEEMKRFSMGIITNEEERKNCEKLQEELLEMIRKKRELAESKKLLQK